MVTRTDIPGQFFVSDPTAPTDVSRRVVDLESIGRLAAATGDWVEGSAKDPQTIIDSLLDVLALDAGSIRLREETSGDFVLFASKGLPWLAERISLTEAKEGPSLVVARSGKLMVISDITDAGGAFSQAASAGFTSFIGVPFIDRNKVVGTLMGLSRNRRTFTLEDEKLILTCGKILGLAVSQWKSLTTADEERLRWQKAFDSMSEGIAFIGMDYRIERANAALYRLLNRSPEEVAGQPCHRLLHNSEGPLLGCPLTSGTEATPTSNEFLVNGRWLEFRIDRVKRQDGKLAGAIHVIRDITEKKLIVDSTARQMRLGIIQEISQAVSGSLNLDLVLHLAITSIAKALHCDGGMISYLDQDSNELTLAAHTGFPIEIARRLERKKVTPLGSSTIEARIATLGEPVVLNDSAVATSWQIPPGSNARRFGDWIGLPLKAQDSVIAILCLFAAGPGNFDPTDSEMLETIGNIVGMAIANARLFHAVESGRNEWLATFDSVGDGLAVVGRDYRILRANRALAQILSTTPEALKGQYCYEAVHRKKRRPAWCASCTAAKIGEPFHATVLEPALGNRWLDIRVDPLRARDGELQGFVHTFKDITETYMATQRQHEREELFLAIFKRAPIGIQLFDADGRFLDANPAILGILGVKSTVHLDGASLFDDPNLPQRARAAIMAKRRVRYEGTYDFSRVHERGYFRTSRNGTIYVSVVIMPLGGKTPNDGGFIVLTEDVTQRRQIAQQIKDSESSFRALAQNAKSGIVIVQAGKVVYVNRMAADIAGETRKGFSSRQMKDLLPAADQATIATFRRRILAGKSVSLPPVETALVRRDGRKLPVEVIAAKTVWHGRRATLLTITDISSKKKLTSDMQFYVSQAIKAQEEERKRISRELHDDLMQSLCLSSLELDGLSRGLPAQSEGLSRVRGQIDRALVNARRFCQELRPEILDQFGLVPAVQALAEAMTERDGIRTTVRCYNMPERLAPEAEIVLYRIAQEALSNIRKHSGATRVRISFKSDAITTTLVVVDDGRGFKVGDFGDLTPQGKLGLKGMQERARLINGTLLVRSRPGRGTRLSVSVPNTSISAAPPGDSK